MIKAHIVRDKSKFVWEFTVEGHAGYRKHGNDIVCAAVSAIVYTALGGLDELIGFKDYVEKDGYMKCSLSLDMSCDKKLVAGIILDTMVIGLKQIEYSYRKHVLVLDEEV